MVCEFALQFSSTETKVAFSNNSDFHVTLFDFFHFFFLNEKYGYNKKKVKNMQEYSSNYRK